VSYCLPVRATHTIFCHASAIIDQGKGNAGMVLYATAPTTRLIQQKYFLKETIWFYLF